MNPRPFEVWKTRPPGFETDHWFVIVSPPEVCSSDREFAVNGLACFTLRGEAQKVDVRLNGADGFDRPTVCACDHFYHLDKRRLSDSRGPVSFERQQQIKARLREVFRL
jgi:mRNA-degrading endonuclease toxin of MazEF toxin-antitoxin module